MTPPILTTTRISDRPVRWQTRFAASGDGYSIELLGHGRTPSDAQAAAATNLERVKARLLVAAIEFGSHRVPSIEGAEG